jgi:hypothetical protein
MSRFATLALVGSLICFGIFFTNVAFGAAKKGVFLGDVAEMLMLFASTVLFVIGVLGKEARAEKTKKTSHAE